MKTRVFAASVFFSLFVATTAHAQYQYFLPQVANGSFADGKFRTTFVVFNNTNASVAATIKLSDANGNPLTLTIPGMGTFSLFNFNLVSGASRIVQTDGSGSLVTGTALINATGPIGVSGIFTVYDGRDNFSSEAGVGSSQSLTDFMMPVETTGTSYTGLALLNTALNGTSVTYALQNAQGGNEGRRTQILNSNAQFVHFVTDPELFPGTKDFHGTLAVQSTQPLAALSLRQNSSPPSYTSLPVVARTSAGTSLNLAQIANGSFGNGSFRTTFLIFNPSARVANVVLSLTQNDGSPLQVTIPGKGTNSTFNVQLPANGSAALQTDGSGNLTSGAATLTSDTPVGASAIFTVFDPQGQFSTEAGVGDSAVLKDFTLPVDSTGFFETGVAFFNPGSSNVSVTLKLLDANGNLARTGAAFPLPPRGHTAQFLSQLFPGINNFRGTVAASATAGIAAMTLRQYNDMTRLCYTTLPVVQGTAAGTTSAPVLLTQTKLISNVSTDIANVYGNLPLGFRLSGTIRGAGVASSVAAVSGDTSFPGAVDPASGRYVIPVPAGTYTLRVCCQTATTAPGLRKSYTDPNPVLVARDTTRDTTLPEMTAFRVSGTVSGLGSINAFAPAIVFTLPDLATQGIFAIASDGTYQGALPEGTYQVSLTGAVMAGSGPTANLAIDLGSFTSSADSTASFDVPATARLSGTIALKGLPLKPGANVAVIDTALGQPPSSRVTFMPGTSVSSIDIITGQYRAVLADGREFSLTVTTPVVHSGVADGAAIFATPGLVAVAGDTTKNLSLDAPTGFATITGLVLDGMNRRVAGVTVTARSQGLPGAPDLTYVGTATTNAQGGYAVQVLVGNIYEVTYTPPFPTP